MKLTKNIKKGAVALAIVFVIFCVISFAVPFAKGSVFWVGFIFGLIAILAQAPIWIIAFKGAESARSKFYGIPIARIGVIYLIVQLILSLAAMFLAWIPSIPAWPFIVVFIIILGAAALGTIAADVTREEIERQDVQIKRDVSKMRELQSISTYLANNCKDKSLFPALNNLAEELRYSDPVSSEASAESEAELKHLLTELQASLLDQDTSAAIILCEQAQTTLAERNRICKLNKA